MAKQTPHSLILKFGVLLAFVVVLLVSGCSTPKPSPVVTRAPETEFNRPEENPDYWVEKTSGQLSDSGRFITYQTQPVTENWPGESLRWSLRTVTEAANNNGPETPRTVHQLYFHLRYKGDRRDYRWVDIQGLGNKATQALAQQTGSCDYGCILEEDFVIEVSQDDLNRMTRNKESRVTLSPARTDQKTQLLIPSAYIRGHLKAISGD